jgi:hypothetical protein
MRTIKPYPLEFTLSGSYKGTVAMPRGAQIVHFAVQFRGSMDSGPRRGIPTVWAEADDQEPLISRTFHIFGDGHHVADGANHVGSYDAEPFMGHVYDVSWVVEIPDEIEEAGQEAVNAYRLLAREGFQYAPDHEAPVWYAPDNEPQSTEQMMALATLAEFGLGTLASA